MLWEWNSLRNLASLHLSANIVEPLDVVHSRHKCITRLREQFPIRLFTVKRLLGLTSVETICGMTSKKIMRLKKIDGILTTKTDKQANNRVSEHCRALQVPCGKALASRLRYHWNCAPVQIMSREPLPAHGCKHGQTWTSSSQKSINKFDELAHEWNMCFHLLFQPCQSVVEEFKLIGMGASSHFSLKRQHSQFCGPSPSTQ